MNFQFKGGAKLQDVVRTCILGDCRLPYGQGKTKDKGIWLVKDEGVYLIPANQEKANPCYAEGWGEDTYIGGDDFAEFIPLSREQISRILIKNGSLGLTLTDTQITVKA